ncbi:ABC transporter permease [Candidatus Microgenomates bacterium]|nr:ABC transporter permease [Candidatus Microgenomates bacterium]
MENFKDLLFEFVKADFKLRYKNSALGFIWVLLKPFLMFLILYLVFNFIFKSQDPNYALNLLLGIIIFYFFSESTMRGLTSLWDRSSIILKVNFNRQLVIFAPIINAFINFFFSMTIFFIFWFFAPTPITWWWLIFPVYILILALFILGFSFYASVWYARARDLANIWEVVLSLLFYVTPIVYPINIIPAQYHSMMNINPLTSIIRDSRLILIYGHMPGLYSIIYVGGVGLFLAITGWFYFKKSMKKIAEEL